MTASASRSSRKLASGPSTWRRRPNARRSRQLGRETHPTDGSNIFRWYRAGWGQYTQPDPIGLIADKNLYRYAASAPANVTDRFGLWPTTPLKCCYYMYKCSSEGTDCSNKLKTKLGSMDEEEKYELFVAGGVATESDYLKKKCFDSNPNCKAMIIECGKEAAKPFPYFTKDSANSDPLPMSPKPWWKFWN